MTKIIIAVVGGTLLISAVMIFGFSGQNQKESGRVEISQPEYDFGAISMAAGKISRIFEVKNIGEKTFKATSEIIPQYVRRAKRSEYQAEIRQNMFQLAASEFNSPHPEKPDTLPRLELLENPNDLQTGLLTAMVYPYGNISWKNLKNKISRLSGQKKDTLIKTFFGERKNRRDRPGRGLETGYPLTFDLVTNWGVYKDLMRHRMNTQLRQLFTTEIGFEIPEDLISAGFRDKVQECVDQADLLFKLIAKEDPILAQYAVLHGHYIRWSLGINAREAFHLLELRTVAQGHWQYRRAAQEMHKLILKRLPWLGEAMKFVDHKDYFWSRADSEARQRAAEDVLDKKIETDTLDKMTPIT